MPVIPITDLSDPRIEIYRDLPAQTRQPSGDKFIVEGKWLVDRLTVSPIQIDSLFVEQNHVNKFVDSVSAKTLIYVAPKDLLRKILGFRFHRCVLACGRRPGRIALRDFAPGPEQQLIVACDNVSDPENLGGILRNCAAFGVNTVIVGSGTTDPYRRRVIRVSMGAAFQTQIVYSENLPADLRKIGPMFGFRLVGSVLDDAAVALTRLNDREKTILLLGNEASGLGDELVSLCDRLVTIPMAQGIDSLNVAVASGILLHHFWRA